MPAKPRKTGKKVQFDNTIDAMDSSSVNVNCMSAKKWQNESNNSINGEFVRVTRNRLRNSKISLNENVANKSLMHQQDDTKITEDITPLKNTKNYSGKKVPKVVLTKLLSDDMLSTPSINIIQSTSSKAKDSDLENDNKTLTTSAQKNLNLLYSRSSLQNDKIRRSKSDIDNATDTKGSTPEISRNSIHNVSKEESLIVEDCNTTADRTYELIEPITPNLREVCRKYSVLPTSVNDIEQPIQQVSKVHFASPVSSITENMSSHNSEVQAGKINHRPKKSTHNYKANIQEKNTVSKYAEFSQPSSFTNIPVTTTTSTGMGTVMHRPVSAGSNNSLVRPIAFSKNVIKKMPKSVPMSNTTPSSLIKKSSKKSKNEVQKTVLPTESNKISDQKTPLKKLPNFADIHRKAFAKMESLIDVKKRIEERHTALTTKGTSHKNDTRTPLQKEPIEPGQGGVYNRFGFKLARKEAAKALMSKKLLSPRVKYQERNRLILKGVRTNRRFELQMKLRNLHS